MTQITEHFGDRGNSSSSGRGHMRVNSIRLDTVPSMKERGAMDMLHKYDQQGIPVGPFTYVKLLQRCIKTRDLAVGKQIHEHIFHGEVQANNFVINTLINMYTKCGSVVIARQVFDKLLKKDVVSWNLMIGAYAQHGHAKEAFTLFCEMRPGWPDTKQDHILEHLECM